MSIRIHLTEHQLVLQVDEKKRCIIFYRKCQFIESQIRKLLTIELYCQQCITVIGFTNRRDLTQLTKEQLGSSYTVIPTLLSSICH